MTKRNITIYTMDGCGNCTAAKALLGFKQVPHTTINVPGDMSTRDFVESFPNVRAFPCIVAEDGSYLGGLKELQSYLLAKELGEMSI
jgi:glutaredoxin